MKIDFYYVNKDYIKYLKDYEKQHRGGFTCVPNIEYANRDKFVYGAVLEINKIKYYVPVSSQTKGKQDDILIRDKKNIIKGSLRFAYMIPVPNCCISTLVIDNIKSENRKILVSKELAFCRKNKDKIQHQAQVTYDRILSGKHPNLNRNSCDFKVLEAAWIQYCIDNNIALPKEIVNKESDGLSEKINCPQKTTSPLSRDMIKKNAKTISNKHSGHQPAQKNKNHNNDLS